MRQSGRNRTRVSGLGSGRGIDNRGKCSGRVKGRGMGKGMSRVRVSVVVGLGEGEGEGCR